MSGFIKQSYIVPNQYKIFCKFCVKNPYFLK